MGEVFDHKEAVFFVGGTGNKDGDAFSGGCTKEWYDANFTQLSDIMATDGAPLVTSEEVSFTNSTKNFHQTNIGVGVEVGMVAYISGTFITPGLYELTTRVGDDDVIFSGVDAVGDNTDSTVNIGGALSSLQVAFNAVDAAAYNVWVYTNKDETLVTQLSLVYFAGTPELNTWLTVEGFNTTIGDMLPGGAYYQSPLSELIFGIDDDCKVKILGNGSVELLNFNEVTNVAIQCMRFTHAANYTFSATNTPSNVLFRHCTLDDASYVCNADCNGFVFEDCYVTNMTTTGNVFKLKGYSFWFSKCLLNLSGTVQTGINLGLGDTYGDINITNSIILNGAVAIHTKRYIYATNNTFYNQAAGCLLVDGDTSTSISLLYAKNNIMMPSVHTVPAIVLGGGAGRGGGIVNDYNCIFSVDGQVLDKVVANDAGTEIETLFDENNILADPLMVDPANNDFRLKPGSPCLNTGKSTPNSGYTTIGAWQQKQGTRRRKWWW